MNATLTIGQVARLAGVNIQTLRYYERRRLLAPIARKPSGYRLYGEAAVRRLTFIRNAQELGFTLKEIADLLGLRVNNTARCEDVKRRAQTKLTEVQKRLKRLQQLKGVLEELVRSCEARRPTTDCPILHSLEQKEVSHDHNEANRRGIHRRLSTVPGRRREGSGAGLSELQRGNL